MQYTQGHFAKAYNKKYKKTGCFWNGRYKSTIIESEEYYMNCLLYIELNMVRNGATKHPKNWKYSSYNQHAQGQGIFEIDYHNQYELLGKTSKERQEKYQSIMSSKIKEKQLLKKQTHMSQAVIYGSQHFAQGIINKYTTHKYYQGRVSRYSQDIVSKSNKVDSS